ncbi:MAG TPA: Flp pilus assembly protein CpaB [Candidatus Elarobacter sp.]|jgi:pilus assembly protein CpaB|nr:Flp pilus assembly protein CpaB [Candidatus Elarobacter sp.]
MSRVLARPLDTRTIALSVAGLLAVGTGVLTYNYLASVGHANAPATQRVILVASRAIPAHSLLTADMLARASRPADAVDPDTLVIPSSAIGSLAVNDIPAGSALTASKLVRQSAVGLPGKVHVGMRAVSIALDRVKGVSNLIRAGDRVDVIAATVPRQDQAPKAVTIIRGALVLSIGTMTDPGATPAPDANGSSQSQFLTATLEVDPKQADLLTLADVNTMLRLALRSPREALHSRPVEKLVLNGAQPPPARSAPAVMSPLQGLMPLLAPRAAQAATPKPVPTPAVAIIDGDHFVTGSGH